MRLPLLIPAVVVSLLISTISYMSGSAPEWTVLKSSIGLLALGVLGWVASGVLAKTEGKSVSESKGRNVDTTLPVAAPDGPEVENGAPEPVAAE